MLLSNGIWSGFAAPFNKPRYGPLKQDVEQREYQKNKSVSKEKVESMFFSFTLSQYGNF